jgi:urease accessory protein
VAQPRADFIGAPRRDAAQITAMLRVTKLLRGHRTDVGRVVDIVVLDHERRRHCHGPVVGTKGTQLFVDFAEPAPLRAGDALVLDTGDLVEVAAEPEALIEVRATDLSTLARIAWALGDRHVPVQILTDRLRLRPDTALEVLLADLGGQTQAVVAPFDPEGGAYLSSDRDDHHHHHETPGKPSSS